jgi:hypothetical protein
VSEPVVFISHFGIKEGMLDDMRRHSAGVMEQLHEAKPRTVLFLAYLDEQGSEVSFLHAFPDAESMDLHFEGVDERVAAAYQYLEPRGWEIYGRPNEGALDSMRQAATSAGVSLTVLPDHLGGFLRLQPG